MRTWPDATTLIDTRGRKQFEDALVDGRPGERRVVLSNLVALCTKNEAAPLR